MHDQARAFEYRHSDIKPGESYYYVRVEQAAGNGLVQWRFGDSIRANVFENPKWAQLQVGWASACGGLQAACSRAVTIRKRRPEGCRRLKPIQLFFFVCAV